MRNATCVICFSLQRYEIFLICANNFALEMHFVRFFVSSSVRSRVVYEGISWFALSPSEAAQKWLKKNARFA